LPSKRSCTSDDTSHEPPALVTLAVLVALAAKVGRPAEPAPPMHGQPLLPLVDDPPSLQVVVILYAPTLRVVPQLFAHCVPFAVTARVAEVTWKVLPGLARVKATA
jgi:MYXO-CTERM domain-containing protein